MLSLSKFVLSLLSLGALTQGQGAGPSGPISDALYRKFELLAQYAAAAYCPDNFNRQNSQLRCQANNCPRVQSANTRVVWSFSKTPQTDNSGFVAIDHTHQTIVISFRGSESVRNYVTFFDTHLVPIELCPSCYSSSGYWRAWLEVREDVTTAAKQAHLQYPGYTLVVTGHSLGGAIATLAAANLRDNGAIVDLASFGAPRIGNDATVAHIMNQRRGANYRVVHAGDVIPGEPRASMGYRHISPEYMINSDNETPPRPRDIIQQPGDESSEGFLFTNPFDAAGSHLFYFNKITECSGGGFYIPFKH